MGRKAKLKAMRKAAAGLPKLKQNRTTRERLTGQQLLDQGVTSADGVSVIADVRYTVDKQKGVDVDHYENMKKIYNKRGQKGVDEYKANIVSHYENLKRNQQSRDTNDGEGNT